MRRERLGVPQGARDVFTLLSRGGWIDESLAESLRRMVGFRNIAAQEYQTLQLPIVVTILTERLDDFLAFSRTIPRKGSGES